MYMISNYGGSSLAGSYKKKFEQWMLSIAWQQYIGSTTFEYYEEFLKLCSDYLKEISISNNPISILENISCLLWEGFFSHDDTFEYSMDTASAFSAKLGINVVLGKGVCRHVSSFATDLLLKFGIYCDNFCCYTSNIRVAENLMGESNHMANLIKYNGNYYVYDVLINRLLSFISPIEVGDFENKNFFYYKPKIDIELGRISLIDLERRLREFKTSTDSKTISRKEYDEIVKETTFLYTEHIGLLPDFVKEIDKVKRKICQEH